MPILIFLPTIPPDRGSGKVVSSASNRHFVITVADDAFQLNRHHLSGGCDILSLFHKLVYINYSGEFKEIKKIKEIKTNVDLYPTHCNVFIFGAKRQLLVLP